MPVPLLYGWFDDPFPPGDLSDDCALGIRSGWKYLHQMHLESLLLLFFCHCYNVSHFTVDSFFPKNHGDLKSLVNWRSKKTPAKNTSKPLFVAGSPVILRVANPQAVRIFFGTFKELVVFRLFWLQPLLFRPTRCPRHEAKIRRFPTWSSTRKRSVYNRDLEGLALSPVNKPGSFWRGYDFPLWGCITVAGVLGLVTENSLNCLGGKWFSQPLIGYSVVSLFVKDHSVLGLS